MGFHAQRKTKTVAFHEAGHAVMACLLAIPFKTVSIFPRRGCAGRIELSGMWPDYAVPCSKDFDADRMRYFCAKDICMTLAGPGAEILVTNRWIRPDDRDGADEFWAQEMAFIAYGDPHGGPNVQHALNWVNRLRIVTLKLLMAQDTWSAVKGVAIELQRRRTLSAQEVFRLVARHVVPGSLRLTGVLPKKKLPYPMFAPMHHADQGVRQRRRSATTMRK